MTNLVQTGLLVVLMFHGASVVAEPLRMDLTTPLAPVLRGHLGLGETNGPGGRSLAADSGCLYLNGRPFIPVMGEFHFTRYPAEEWRDALLKMKAGGVDIVATYVFWIHHEEERGKFDWSGRRSLRDFLNLCRELDLLALVRLGPWAHGEVRNGGFPDWVQHAEFWVGQKGFKHRATHPEFMKWTEILYRQIEVQMRGLLWKDGGPVIGVQHDNECGNLPYLLALKQLARECGMDAPFYTMTGWNAVPIPDGELLPLFGGYADGFWLDDPLRQRRAFLFTPSRDDGDMGAIDGRLVNTRPDRAEKLARFPYVCCEIGGGMPSSYARRIHVAGADVAAPAVVKLGKGNNLPGYYMYHGGVNPEGRLSTLNETKATHYPNDLPVKDYDFGPVGAMGQVREHYFLLRQQHLFLRSFGERLALMPAFLPEHQPLSLDDVDTVRWSVRSDGASGFIFFNHHQRYQQLPEKSGLQFVLKTTQGTARVPRQPLTLPSGSYGFWPFNLDCAGVTLEYATAQPLCPLRVDDEEWFFFSAIEGIAPEFVVVDDRGKSRVRRVKPGMGVGFRETSPNGARVCFVVLPTEQGRWLWKLPLSGRERVVLCSNALLPEAPDRIGLEWLPPQSPNLAIFPPVTQARINGGAVQSGHEGIFQRFRLEEGAPATIRMEAQPVKAAAPGAGALNAMEETSWNSAAVWRLRVPQTAPASHGLLRLHYVGDVARFYAGGRLVLDQFYNGQPMDLALWRLTPAELADLELRLLPCRVDKVSRWTEEALAGIGGREDVAEISRLEVLERRRMVVALPAEAD
jgi:beta-galactosidase